jgi:SLT domain-containing protein
VNRGYDDQLVMAQAGELIVPTPIVQAGDVDHLRRRIPGFASGGVVGNYSGRAAGAGGWAQHEVSATNRAVQVATASAITAALAATGAGLGGSGVARWAPLILRVLGMLGQSSANLGAVEHRMAQESGGNPQAINLWDSNAAAGDPSRGLMQTIMSTFLAYAGPFRSLGIYNPEANIYAGLNYALHAYPGRSLSSVMLQPGGYDEGGWLPSGHFGMNSSGKPEPVFSNAQWQILAKSVQGGDGASATLTEIRDEVRALRTETGKAVTKTGTAVGAALNGTSNLVANRSRYQTGA